MASLVERRESGIRSFDPYRDLEAIVDLIDVSFGEQLDPVGKIALEELRRAAQWGALWWWLRPLLGGKGIVPGFVWVEEGAGVVGNVSLRRSSARGGFMIGNVVVHPDWREQGIARALMEVALDDIVARGGRWAGLEVRVDNLVARHLYDTLGFKEVGSTVHMLRPSGLSWAGDLPRHKSLRRGRGKDTQLLLDLVRSIIPEPQRSLMELRAADYRAGWIATVESWLTGRHETWWVFEKGNVILGAVRVVREWSHRPHRLEILVSPDQAESLSPLLLQRGLTRLKGSPDKMVETVLPCSMETSIQALEKLGFRRERVLVQMRRSLGHHIAIGD
jgi:GNAT superfamily N-acetyltransferase